MAPVVPTDTPEHRHPANTHADAAPADRPGSVRPPRSSKPGPRLSGEQRTIVRRLVAQYMDAGAVQAVLQTDYPEYPSVSDRYLRQLCHDVATGKAGSLADEVQAQQVHMWKHGLARKENRVKELQRIYGQVLTREAAEDNPQRRIALIRERRAILSQIAQEIGPDGQHRTRQHPDALGANSRTDNREVGASEVATNSGLADMLRMFRARLWSADATTPLDLDIYPAEAHADLMELYDLLSNSVSRTGTDGSDRKHA